jgi:hypothetical protein
MGNGGSNTSDRDGDGPAEDQVAPRVAREPPAKSRQDAEEEQEQEEQEEKGQAEAPPEQPAAPAPAAPPVVNTAALLASSIKSAMQTRGMPDPTAPEYAGKAAPMLFEEMQTPGWDLRQYGIPACVELPRLGACQIIGQKDEWCCVVFCDQGLTVPDERNIAHPLVPAPRWGLPWRVADKYVTRVNGIVKAITTNAATGVRILIVMADTLCDGPDGVRTVALKCVSLGWEDVMARQPSTAKYTDILRRFELYNPTTFMKLAAGMAPPPSALIPAPEPTPTPESTPAPAPNPAQAPAPTIPAATEEKKNSAPPMPPRDAAQGTTDVAPGATGVLARAWLGTLSLDSETMSVGVPFAW